MKNELITKIKQDNNSVREKMVNLWIDNYTPDNVVWSDRVMMTAKTTLRSLDSLSENEREKFTLIKTIDNKKVMFKFLYNFKNEFDFKNTVGLTLRKGDENQNYTYFKIVSIGALEEFDYSHVYSIEGKEGRMSYTGCKIRMTLVAFVLEDAKQTDDYYKLESFLDPYSDFNSGKKLNCSFAKGECGDFYESTPSILRPNLEGNNQAINKCIIAFKDYLLSKTSSAITLIDSLV